MPFRYESPTIRQAATALGVIGFACVGSMTVLAYQTRPIPDALASIGGGAVGALATLLTTFTPSPVPGGRRAADAVTAIDSAIDPAAAAVGPTGPPPPAARQFGTGGS
jgi:hypothetical protein